MEPGRLGRAWRQLLAPDFEVDATDRVLNPDHYEGIEGFRRLAGEMAEVWDSWEIEPLEFLENGEPGLRCAPGPGARQGQRGRGGADLLERLDGPRRKGRQARPLCGPRASPGSGRSRPSGSVSGRSGTSRSCGSRPTDPARGSGRRSGGTALPPCSNTSPPARRPPRRTSRRIMSRAVRTTRSSSSSLTSDSRPPRVDPAGVEALVLPQVPDAGQRALVEQRVGDGPRRSSARSRVRIACQSSSSARMSGPSRRR